ncbi:MAG: RNA polymerase sigma factor [bacterium]
MAELFQRYSDIAYTVCLKYLKNQEDCRDAVLEIFAGIVEDLKYRDILDFKSWLYIVAKNHCLMKVRQNASRKAVSQKSDGMEDLADENAEGKILDQIDEELLMEEIATALNQLDEAQRTCLILFYFEEKSYHEIAQITKLDLKQVKSHLQNGKRNLKKILLQRRARDHVK